MVALMNLTGSVFGPSDVLKYEILMETGDLPAK